MNGQLNIEYCHIYLSEFLEKGTLTEAQLQEIKLINPLISYFEANFPKSSRNVLVDNYFPNEITGYDPEEIFNALQKEGIAPDFIFMEGLMKQYCEQIISQIDQELTQERNKRLYLSEHSMGKSDRKVSVTTYDSIDYSVLLTNVEHLSDNLDSEGFIHDYEFYLSDILLSYVKGGRTTYSCPLLAAVWYLARLGIEPYRRLEEQGYRYSKKPFCAERLLTILSIDYLKVEAASSSILKAINNEEVNSALAEGRMQYYIV